MNPVDHLKTIKDKYYEIAALTAQLQPNTSVEEFEDVIRTRKGILSEIKQCRATLERRYPDWRQYSGACSLAADIQSIIQYIINTDRYAEELMKDNLREIGSELKTLRASSSAARGYTRQAAFKAA
ncbi:MAG: hypothetical protein ACOC41_09255 [Chitinivibrionales bacterium]